MKLYCLNGDPNYPCYVLTAKGCTIMLDCALNLKVLQHFLPLMLVPTQRFENTPNFRTNTGVQIDSAKEFNNRVFINSTLEFSTPQFDLINIEDIDAVLISNFNSMLALPYLTKLKEFRANIYVTEPTMHLGRILMEELTYYVKSNQMRDEQTSSSDLKKTLRDELIENKENLDQPPNKQKKPNNDQEDLNGLSWKQFSSNLAQAFNISESHLKPHNWKMIYTREDIDLCMSKMKLVDFDEKLNIFGSLIAYPKSSGYSLGSCNWTIEADCDSILYLSRSSVLNTHSKLFNQQFLKSQSIVDCLVLTGLNQAALHEPEQMVMDFCKACIVTIKNQGSVLIPTLPTGKIYDLIEILHRFLCDANMSNVPVYFVSSFANQSLAYSNIFAEWLCDSKQSLAYAAEYPFQHGDLVKTGFLKVYPSINAKFNEDFAQPCILFTSHPSLRFGEACHFVDMWKNSLANSFIFIEPEFNHLDALAPFQPVYANSYYFPIDTCLNTNQLHKLLKDTKHITQLIVSNQYKLNDPESNEPIMMVNDELAKIDHSKLSPNTVVNYYNQNDIVKLTLKRKYENCELESDLTAMIMPTKNVASRDPNEKIIPNVSFSTFKAQLITKNNSHLLKPAPRTIPVTRRDRLRELNLRKYTHGKLNLNLFIKNLVNVGLTCKFNERTDETSGEQSNGTDDAYGKTKFTIDFDSTNRCDVDLNQNTCNIFCDNEDIRVKVKDSLLKCLNVL